MDELKTIFGDGAITFEQFSEKLNGADKKTINLANLALGGYVDKGKFDAKVTELTAAQKTITDLQDAVKKFDGVDVDKLKNDMTELQSKYNTDLAAAKLDNALNMALIGAKARDTKLVKSLLDMSIIKQDGDTLLGVKDQLENIVKTHGYLFETDNNNGGDNGGGASMNTGGAHNGSTGKPDFSKMSDDEYFAYIDSHKNKN